MAELHPVVRAAAKGNLPTWAEVDSKRYEHMERVAALLKGWAREAGLSKPERRRWVALGFLHDALKGGAPARLRRIVEPDLRDLPDPILHGPAAAALLRTDGVEDEALLRAIRFHTLGHPRLDDAGRALYAADFLDPGRELRNRWRAALRARMPGDLHVVTREIVGARILHLVRRGRPVRPETIAMWNSLAEGEAWVRASAV
ncbi:MAG: HD domain-containing protein [Longimicrobiales bacterium]|nr:HD domain-containing protein [Longimicrobiales bacterium]